MTTQRAPGPLTTLPKIQFSALQNPTSETIKKLASICEHTGFFIISDHPVPTSIIHRVRTSSRTFFNLPAHTKALFHQDKQLVEPKYCRGYSNLEKLSFEKHLPDQKQLFDLGLNRPLQPGVPFTGPNILPPNDIAQDFADSLLEMQRIVMDEMVPPVTKALALALDKPATFFDEYMGDPMLIQRVVFYPAKTGTGGKHTDNGLFTLLFQEDGNHSAGHGSLQVAYRDSWIHVDAHEHEVVVNLGDILQLWSAGRFVSTAHQVVHRGHSSRVSMPFFVYPAIMSSFKPFGSDSEINVRDAANKSFNALWVLKVGAGRAEDAANIGSVKD